MIDWIVGGIYFFGYLYSVWRLSGQLAWGIAQENDYYYDSLSEGSYPKGYRGPKYPMADQWFGGTILALFVALIWPPVLVASLAVTHKFTFTPHQYREAMKDERIRQLEQEVGIK